ncbi:hypothetical protein K7X08_022760 [Anisodus acutangulus]|uniref:Alanine racemase N-terminal domain-containing protein n=1 Tax=Anisodus acutangulus TaxID=402998 RepID=A0A9Q1ME92_9SOLA|nr:hypothetical protein K7X08_022760 [Anisodus acutangulus]
MAAPAAEGLTVTALRSVYHRVRQAAERSDRRADDVRVVAVTVVPNLAMVHGVDNQKLANHLDRAVSSIGRQPLKVLVQVNTSGEESKSGVDPSNCIELAKHVKLDCPNLEFSGLMTIGRPNYTSTPENFKTLLNCRTEVCKVLGMVESRCVLSMGMSTDFELEIEMDSTNVLNCCILLEQD